jgi:leucyl-tRNA synthetase
MPQWAGSSWYYLRYADPKNDKELADKKLLKHWLPVDVYFGGMEHTTLHLLYSRFWHGFLYDEKMVPTPEPYLRRIPHGIILGSDGEKMSKSRGNVVNPDLIVKEFGADALRMYELFLGPHGATVSWNDRGILGVSRFLDRIYKFVLSKENEGEENSDIKCSLHNAIKKISEDIENFAFNTAVSAFMILLNEVENKKVSKETKKTILKLLAPFAPYITEELWHEQGYDISIHTELWPSFDLMFVEKNSFILVIQVNGRVRDQVEVDRKITKEEVERLALKNEKVMAYTKGVTPKKVIYVPEKIVNIVV